MSEVEMTHDEIEALNRRAVGRVFDALAVLDKPEGPPNEQVKKNGETREKPNGAGISVP